MNSAAVGCVDAAGLVGFRRRQPLATTAPVHTTFRRQRRRCKQNAMLLMRDDRMLLLHDAKH